MSENIAISVNNVSKTFRIPHEKISTLRGAFVNVFKSHTYEEFKALDNISFEVKKGEFFGVIGRNGSGKSTLLKIIAGIYQPDKVYPVKSLPSESEIVERSFNFTGQEVGSAKRKFNGVKINGRISPFLELGIGFNPELSGRDNIYLNAAVLGLTHKQIDEKFDDIVNFSELRRFIDQKVKNYSSGMQVRLMFSVAIHANREILLMDEVLAVGDSNFQSKCLAEFMKYKEEGKTVVLVTHDIMTVQRYCDRAMLLRAGKIEMIGNPERVGYEYILQNMSDEERRIAEEEKQKDESKKTSRGQKVEERDKDEKKIVKAVEIKKAEFLDKNEHIKNVFQTGDDVSIRVYFKRNEPIADLDLGLAIYNIENNCIFGTSTLTCKKDISEILKKGFFQINIKKIPVRQNTYYIKAGIYGAKNKRVYDQSEKLGVFKILSAGGDQGMMTLNYNLE